MASWRIAVSDLDLAIITETKEWGSAAVVRREKLLWVTSSRHAVHESSPIPLALGRSFCTWRHAATIALEGVARPYRVLYSSWNSTAVGAAVLAGLAVSVLPESAVRPGMRILKASDGFPPLPSCKIGLLRNTVEPSALADALAGHIVQSLDNLSGAPVADRIAFAAE